MSIKVLVAESQELVRAGIRIALSGDPQIEIVAEASDAAEAVRLVSRVQPDVVLIDVPLAPDDGLSAIDQIKRERPEAQVLVFSAYDNAGYLARASALGAAGYVLKTAPLSELAQAIRDASTGQALWTQQQVRRAAAAASKPVAHMDVEAPLTDRELQVLRHLANGMTNSQIAETLGISYETVKEHVQHVLRKVGVTSRAQAAVWAVRNQIV